MEALCLPAQRLKLLRITRRFCRSSGRYKTTLIFPERIDLPQNSAIVMHTSEEGEKRLRDYFVRRIEKRLRDNFFVRHIQIAKARNAGFIPETASCARVRTGPRRSDCRRRT